MGTSKRKSNGGRKSSLAYHKVSHLYDTRDTSGVPDMVLLENYQSEDAFIANLKIRYDNDIIYTYIGSVLIAINPYKNIPIYSPEFINKYRGVNLFEMPPHIFALSDVAYRAMMANQSNQSVLISGESGAGKTESMKRIILYIAAASHHTPEVERIREKLQISVPVLEALGNAKTNRNDNSSRFGKYMDIQFNYMGSIVGAKVTSYLLEKSRVVNQNKGERNFHIFYQIFKDPVITEALFLDSEPGNYHYIMQRETITVASLDDAKDLKVIREGFRSCGLTIEEENALFSVIGAILHLGQIDFAEKSGKLEMTKTEHLEHACKLLNCPQAKLLNAMLHRKITSGREMTIANLTKSEAYYARDALAKTIYERCFLWLVERLNASQACQIEGGYKCRLGLLDIFGFEIFTLNSFEQLCINFCNEKLHQLFIEKTLKEEQEDYMREGIEWIPIEYTDNTPICLLLQGSPNGILSLLDEECLMPGNRTDLTLHARFQDKLKENKAFATRTAGGLDKEARKNLKPDEFKIKHYAGEVVYSVVGFMDKNKDLLFRDIKEILCDSKHLILSAMFHKDELDDKKRPISVGFQFKTSLEKLLTTLEKEELHYVRCIKPNMQKIPDTFDEITIRHQVKYMGLVENVRVCRAGFAYKRPYEFFLKRYYSICPLTWPKHYQYSATEAVDIILKHFKYVDGTDYKFGKTKIFVKSACSISDLEALCAKRKIELITLIQANWKRYQIQGLWNDLKNSVTFVQKWIRTFLAQQRLEVKKKAVLRLQRFAKGCLDMKNNQIETEFYKDIFAAKCQNYIKRLLEWAQYETTRESLKDWPKPPDCLKDFSEALKKSCEIILQMQEKQKELMEKGLIPPEELGKQMKKELTDKEAIAKELSKEKYQAQKDWNDDQEQFEQEFALKFEKLRRQLATQFTQLRLKLVNKTLKHDRELLEHLYEVRSKELEEQLNKTHVNLQNVLNNDWKQAKDKAKTDFKKQIARFEILDKEKGRKLDVKRMKELECEKERLEKEWRQKFLGAMRSWNAFSTNTLEPEIEQEWQHVKQKAMTSFQERLQKSLQEFSKEQKKQKDLFKAQTEYLKECVFNDYADERWRILCDIQKSKTQSRCEFESSKVESVNQYFRRQSNSLGTNLSPNREKDQEWEECNMRALAGLKMDREVLTNNTDPTMDKEHLDSISTIYNRFLTRLDENHVLSTDNITAEHAKTDTAQTTNTQSKPQIDEQQKSNPSQFLDKATNKTTSKNNPTFYESLKVLLNSKESACVTSRCLDDKLSANENILRMLIDGPHIDGSKAINNKMDAKNYSKSSVLTNNSINDMESQIKFQKNLTLTKDLFKIQRSVSDSHLNKNNDSAPNDKNIINQQHAINLNNSSSSLTVLIESD